MCLVLLGLDTSPGLPLILIANRDEFYARPTRPLGFWKKIPHILAGQDLEAGGTWMGINRNGRFACLTNYRDLNTLKSGCPSRGEIIPDLLSFEGGITDFMDRLAKTAQAYNGFNLIAGEGSNLFWYSNQNGSVVRLPSGIHGLSNHLLNTPWPKVTRGKELLQSSIEKDPMDDEALFQILRDLHQPKDKALPDTGIGLEWERILAPLFIQSPSYGTRSATLMRVFGDGRITVTERTFGQMAKGSQRPGKNDSGPSRQDRSFTLLPEKSFPD